MKTIHLILRLLTRLGISRGFIRRLIEQCWLKTGSSVIDAKIRGIRYQLHIKRNVTDCKILTSSKIYDKKELTFLAEAVADYKGHFVDIGANTGYYSLSMAGYGCQNVIAIEPNPITINLLEKNISLNQMEKQIHVCKSCVGENGELPLHCNLELGSASVFELENSSAPTMVKSRRLEEILLDEKVESVSAMKLDIEGYEDKALQPFFNSATESLWPKRMIIEHCNKDRWGCDLEAFLNQAGYRTCHQNRSNLFMELVAKLSL